MANKTIDGTANIEAVRFKEAAAPGTPASGYGKLYAKTDGKVYWKDDAGTETDLTASGGVCSISLGGTPDDLGIFLAQQRLGE